MTCTKKFSVDLVLICLLSFNLEYVFSLLSENGKMEIYKIVLLPGCEFHIDGRTQTENSVLRRVLTPKKDKITGG
jgi:hypothetical protein